MFATFLNMYEVIFTPVSGIFTIWKNNFQVQASSEPIGFRFVTLLKAV